MKNARPRLDWRSTKGTRMKFEILMAATLSVLGITGMTSSAFAGGVDGGETLPPPFRTASSPEGIYEALSISEVRVSDIEGSETLEKAVGGLTCQKMTLVLPHAVPQYSCWLSLVSEDDSEIYKSLDVKE